jgi:hypothetical protein
LKTEAESGVSKVLQIVNDDLSMALPTEMGQNGWSLERRRKIVAGWAMAEEMRETG